MLRYFYILVCIQLCFCTPFIDKSDESLERTERGIAWSKSGRVHKKHTKTPTKSQLVHFDVQSFMQTDESYVNNGNYGPSNYRTADDYDSLAEPYGSHKEKNTAADFLDTNDHISKLNTESNADKQLNSKHFNFHSLIFEDKNDVKTHETTETTTANVISLHDLDKFDTEKKCSFKHMKMPFFSFNKSTTKAKRQKKRKLFCFNCHKKNITGNLPNKSYKASDKAPDQRSDEYSKNRFKKTETVDNKVSKRSYDHLCPKCIRELLNSLRRQTTVKGHQDSKAALKHKDSKLKEKTTLQKLDNNLDDTVNDGNDHNVMFGRKKRSDEERERMRRLKELDEVERKIENVHVTAPVFTRVTLNFVH